VLAGSGVDAMVGEGRFIAATPSSSAKINISYSILFHLTTSYSSYFRGKKGISRNKTSFFLLMLQHLKSLLQEFYASWDLSSRGESGRWME